MNDERPTIDDRRRTTVDGVRASRQRNTQVPRRNTAELHRRSQYNSAPSRRPRAAIELDIQDLVLDGFTDVSGELVAASVKGELARLFAAHGVPEGLEHNAVVSAVDVGVVMWPPDADADTLGVHIAEQIYGGLGT